MKALPFHDTKHLYLVCENDTFPPEFSPFKTTLLQGNVISQIGLGKSGIRRYGKDLLVVKKCGNDSDRLLCIAHPIKDSKDYVYIPYEVISHKEYEKLLDNRKYLKQRIQKARDSIYVNLTFDQLQNRKGL